jgi:hypothetical protein
MLHICIPCLVVYHVNHTLGSSIRSGGPDKSMVDAVWISPSCTDDPLYGVEWRSNDPSRRLKIPWVLHTRADGLDAEHMAR